MHIVASRSITRVRHGCLLIESRGCPADTLFGSATKHQCSQRDKNGRREDNTQFLLLPWSDDKWHTCLCWHQAAHMARTPGFLQCLSPKKLPQRSHAPLHYSTDGQRLSSSSRAECHLGCAGPLLNTRIANELEHRKQTTEPHSNPQKGGKSLTVGLILPYHLDLIWR